MQSRKLDAQLRAEGRAQANDTKMLLLGPGESGKSTLFKQMKILAREGGYSEQELQKYKSNIYANCMSQMAILCEAATEQEVQLDADLAAAAALLIETPPSGDNWSLEVCDAIGALWANESIQVRSMCVFHSSWRLTRLVRVSLIRAAHSSMRAPFTFLRIWNVSETRRHTRLPRRTCCGPVCEVRESRKPSSSLMNSSLECLMWVDR